MLQMYDTRSEWDKMQDKAAKQAMETRECHRAVAFYRPLGFRGVGSTIWFAMTPDPDHAFHKLAMSDDFDLPEAPSTFPIPSCGNSS